jgi:hypothetical protein
MMMMTMHLCPDIIPPSHSPPGSTKSNWHFPIQHFGPFIWPFPPILHLFCFPIICIPFGRMTYFKGHQFISTLFYSNFCMDKNGPVHSSTSTFSSHNPVESAGEGGGHGILPFHKNKVLQNFKVFYLLLQFCIHIGHV